VEIVTSTSQVPRKDWLEFVVSGKARNSIRHSIRQAGKERATELGRDIFVRELKKADLSLVSVQSDGRLPRYLEEEFGGRPLEDLFAAISYGKLAAAAVVRRLTGRSDEQQAPPSSLSSVVVPNRIRQLFRRERRRSGSGVLVSGTPDVMVRFAGCCEPLPGDEIIGFVTRGRGVTVHTRGCVKVFALDPERRIDVDWDDGIEARRAIAIRVLSRDEPGILAKVTNTISAAGLNIGSARVSTDEEREGQPAELVFEVLVPDTQTLSAVMREIRRVKGVRSVERVRG
jgi:GTP pyrophosphokinase